MFHARDWWWFETGGFSTKWTWRNKCCLLCRGFNRTFGPDSWSVDRLNLRLGKVLLCVDSRWMSFAIANFTVMVRSIMHERNPLSPALVWLNFRHNSPAFSWFISSFCPTDKTLDGCHLCYLFNEDFISRCSPSFCHFLYWTGVIIMALRRLSCLPGYAYTCSWLHLTNEQVRFIVLYSSQLTELYINYSG